jgi:hypothetical protein
MGGPQRFAISCRITHSEVEMKDLAVCQVSTHSRQKDRLTRKRTRFGTRRCGNLSFFHVAPSPLPSVCTENSGVELIDLHRFENFNEYLATFGGKNSIAYYRRRALRKGYRFARIDKTTTRKRFMPSIRPPQFAKVSPSKRSTLGLKNAFRLKKIGCIWG